MVPDPNWLTDPIIHVNTSTADNPMVCNAAIVGGRMGGNTWLVVMSFNGSRVSWLSDEHWHTLANCTYANPADTGQTQENDGDHFVRSD